VTTSSIFGARHRLRRREGQVVAKARWFGKVEAVDRYGWIVPSRFDRQLQFSARRARRDREGGREIQNGRKQADCGTTAAVRLVFPHAGGILLNLKMSKLTTLKLTTLLNLKISKQSRRVLSL
jgi:hypothetical protein